MILFKMIQYFHGHEVVVSIHTTLADAVASVRLPTEYIYAGSKLIPVSQVGDDRWVVYCETPEEVGLDDGWTTDEEEVATIVRLAS